MTTTPGGILRADQTAQRVPDSPPHGDESSAGSEFVLLEGMAMNCAAASRTHMLTTSTNVANIWPKLNLFAMRDTQK